MSQTMTNRVPKDGWTSRELGNLPPNGRVATAPVHTSENIAARLLAQAQCFGYKEHSSQDRGMAERVAESRFPV